MKRLVTSLVLAVIALTATAQTARVQIIHNSADAAAQQVDVWLNNTLLLDNFNFRTASPFIDAPAGVPLEIRIKGPNSIDTTNPIALFPLPLVANETYVVVADGIVSPTGYSSSPAFNLEVYNMGREAATNSGNTDLLVHHGSTDAPSVDVAEVGVVNATIIDDLAYTDFQGYLELPTADYTLQILDKNGTTPVAAFEAPLSTLNLQGQALVVVASGFLDPSANSNGPAFGLYVALPSGGNLVALPGASNYVARAQIIHNAPDASAQQVDVYVNEALALDNFAFRTATPFIDLPAGVPFDVTIQPANSVDTSNALAQFTYTLMKDEGYTIIADGIVVPTGYNPAPGFNLEVYAGAREAASTTGNTDVLVHHGATDAPAVDIAEVDKANTTLINDIAYTNFQDYLELPTDNYILQLLDENGTTPIATYGASLDALGLRDDAITVVASGFLDPAQNNNGAAFGLFVATANGGPLVPLPAVATQTAKIQVIHNSADATAAQVDVYLNENLAIDNFAFRTATPYIEVPAGVPFDVTIQPANSSDTTNALAQFTYTLTANESYVIVADGIVSSTGYTPSPAFDLEVYAGGREAANLPGNTDILVHHGSTDAPTVDVAEVGVVNSTLVDNLAYTDYQGYLELPTNDYILQILDETGSTTVAAFGAPLNTLGLEGEALVVVASGFLDPSVNSNGEFFGLYAALPSGGPLVALPGGTNRTARVQIIHNSADAAAGQVDVYVNDNLVADNFAFRTATPFIDVPGGIAFDVVIQPANSIDTTNALARFNFMLMPGSTHVIVADGIVSASGYNPAPAFDLEVYSMGREAATNAGNTDVLVHHGATDAPTVDVAEVGVVNAAIVNDLAYTDFQGYLELPTADYTLQILDESGTTPIAAFSAPLSTLNLQGEALTVVASGFVDPSTNSNGPAFGLYAALPAGGPLVALPAVNNATASAQIIHNAADIGATQVDIYLNDQLLLDNFAFRTATPFINVPAGLPIDVVIQPQNSTDTTNALARFNYTLTAGESYVIVADGIASQSGYAPLRPFDLKVYAGARTSASNPNNVDVLVHHGSTDAPTVDVAEISAVGNVLLDNLAYSDFTGYLELPTADYRLQLLNSSATQTIAAFDAPLSTLGLQGGAAVVVASGFVDPSVNGQGPAFGLYAALPSGGPLVALPASTNANAGVQVIHNSADLAAERVDVWLNDEKMLDNFRFRTASPFVDIPAAIPVIVSIAGPASTDTSAALAQFTYTLDENGQYIIVANGIVSASGYNPATPFDLYVQGNARTQAANTGETDVLVFHGATDAPTVDVAEIGAGAGTIVDDLAYGQFQGYLELPTANYRLAVQDQTGSTTVATYDAPLSALGLENAALTVLASGFLNPAANSDGPDFGLYVALPAGGALIPLPVTTGVEDAILGNTQLYPNPARNQARLAFTLEKASEVGYMIVDMRGRVVAGANLGTLPAGQHFTQLFTADWAAGMYKVVITTSSGATSLPLTIQR